MFYKYYYICLKYYLFWSHFNKSRNVLTNFSKKIRPVGVALFRKHRFVEKWADLTCIVFFVAFLQLFSKRTYIIYIIYKDRLSHGENSGFPLEKKLLSMGKY